MANKEATVAELTDLFRNSNAVVLTEYRGLITAFDDELAGPSAIAFVHGDTVTVAKALRDFSKANPLLVVKGGYFDGAPLTAEEVGKLADLESREVLLAKLAGLFKAPLFGAAYLFQAPLSKAVRTVDALREKQESAS
jgi:large subunit ribosomal protein L10